MKITEVVNLILEGNGWDLDAVPIDDWLPLVGKQLHNSQPNFDILNDPDWYKNLSDEATAWFNEANNVMEFLLDKYDGDTVIHSMRTLMHEYQLTLSPMNMDSWTRFRIEHGDRLIEMSNEGIL